MSTPEVKVEPNTDTLAEAIVKISAGVAALLKSGLNRKAIIVLLHDRTHVGKREITDILNGLGDLEKLYCRK